MKKDKVITIAVILIVLILAFVVISTKGGNAPEDIAKCIGENSVLYVQDGCPHCENQQALFGANVKYLTIVNCNDNWLECQDIKGTPSWEINGEIIEYVQSIETLKELTGC